MLILLFFTVNPFTTMIYNRDFFQLRHFLIYDKLCSAHLLGLHLWVVLSISFWGSGQYGDLHFRKANQYWDSLKNKDRKGSKHIQVTEVIRYDPF